MSEKYETETETEEYLEYPENQEKNEDCEFLKELTSTHCVEKKVLSETELKKQETNGTFYARSTERRKKTKSYE